MKNIEDLDLSSVNRMFYGLKPLMIAPDFESGTMLPSISQEMYAVLLLAEENEIKQKCVEGAKTLNFELINIYLFDLAEQKKEIETLWAEGAIFTYEREGKDIQLVFHPLEAKKFINVKLRHIQTLNEYLNSLIGRKKKIANSLTHRHHALIYKYKAAAGYITPNSFNGTEIEKKFGSKRKQAFYSIWDKKGKTYKGPTVDELKSIIPYLVSVRKDINI